MNNELEAEQYVLSPSQGVRFMALAQMLREHELLIVGDRGNVHAAMETIADIAQEIALQVRV